MNARSIAAAAILLAAAAMPTSALESDPSLAGAARQVTQIVAHRGASAERPENTLAAIRRAIEAGATAVEVDVRTTKDGALVLSHDGTLDRTTSGSGPINQRTLAEIRALDAGSWFAPKFSAEHVPTLDEALALCHGRIDVLLDLKETGDAYADKVAAAVNARGDARRTIVGVRSVEQALQFRRLLPEARQLGLIATPDDVEAYAAAGVETIRLWPKWLDGASPVERVRKAGAKLHLNGTTGQLEEARALLTHRPDSLSSDDPRQLVATLRELGRGRLRVLTYNIHHAEGIDGKLDLERIASVVRAAEPDIVALQEVDQRTKRSGGVAQADELAKLTGMKVVFGGNIDFEGGGYGNAVLSRLPVRRHENHRLPRLDDGEQRGVLEVEIETRAGPLVVLATHLDHRRDGRERLASAEAINDLVAKRAAVPALLIGDLNAVPESEVMQAFAKRWQRANESVLPTIPVGRPTRQIDYVLFRPANRWKVVEARVLDEAIASDHRPLLAVLGLMEDAAARETE